MTCRELTFGFMEAGGISAADPASVRTKPARVDNSWLGCGSVER